MKKKDLNVFRFGRGGRGPIDALRKRIRSWAHKRRDWTPSPLLFLAHVRRHALYLGEDEGWALEPEPLTSTPTISVHLLRQPWSSTEH